MRQMRSNTLVGWRGVYREREEEEARTDRQTRGGG